ncbi:UNVERIFIED_CONTAM: small-conductance mechanosensitive channel [Acetivibrio alkalicellulosi]
MIKLDIDIILNIVGSLVVIITIYAVKSLLLKVLHSKIEDISSYYKVRRIVNVSSFFIIILLLLLIWIRIGSSVTTYLGLFSAGIALALKDILINISAWIYILIRKPFEVGQRIEIDGVKGDVIDQSTFHFSMIEIGNWVDAEQSTGRIIHFPNHKIFTNYLANYSTGFEYIWNEIKVTVTFESDWKKAKKILKEIADKHTEDLTKEMQESIKEASKKYMIYYNNLTPIVYTDVKDSGIVLTIRYVCKPQERRISSEAIWESILDTFQQQTDIEIAYPTRRVVNKA